MIYGIINTTYNTISQKAELGDNIELLYISSESSINEITQKLNRDTKIITTDISNLSLMDSTAAETFQTIFNTGADIEIIHSPALSSNIFKSTLIETTDKRSVKETELVITAVTNILVQQIEKELNNSHVPAAPSSGRKGNTYITKKEKSSIIYMKENLTDFGGTLTDQEAMEALKLSRNTFYKYKKKLRAIIDLETRKQGLSLIP